MEESDGTGTGTIKMCYVQSNSFDHFVLLFLGGWEAIYERQGDQKGATKEAL